MHMVSLVTYALLTRRAMPLAHAGGRSLASRSRQAVASRAASAALQMTTTRTRFAPSPTGSLHVGGARTALFSWLKAQQDGGKFVIRVEDTDTARSTRESESEVLADLKWLGLVDDEGPIVGGDKGPYRQSERMEAGLYQQYADQLLASGQAYKCFCTAEELEAKRQAAEAAGEDNKYDGTWRDADPEEVQRRVDAGEPYTVRFKVPRGKQVTIQDRVRGEVTWDVEATLGDFILLRSGGMPVYNFCVAIDDALMEVSNVVRAIEHLTNTVRQVLVLEALGFPVPEYAHLSLVLGEDRSKLSKRHGATSVDQFRRQGYLPQAMLNYLSLLGWNDQSDQEIYSVDELIKSFSLDRVTKSPAVFDVKKLNWVNGQHLRALPEAERACLIGDLLVERGLAKEASSPFCQAAALMVAAKIELVNDAVPLIEGAMLYPLAEADDKMLQTDGLDEVGGALLKAYEAGSFPDPSSETFTADFKAMVKGVGKDLGRKGKGLFMPMRIALTGRMAGPEVVDQLRVLALAPAHSEAPCVPLEQRMRVLAETLGKLAPA